MLSRELAEKLRDAGVPWEPASGDRFMIPGKDMDDEIFVISEMTIEAVDVPSGRIVKFNGTTEWALDSISAAEVLWLPREDQLRELLGEEFGSLESVTGGFTVVTRSGARHSDIDAERAYARAVLARYSR